MGLLGPTGSGMHAYSNAIRGMKPRTGIHTATGAVTNGLVGAGYGAFASGIMGGSPIKGALVGGAIGASLGSGGNYLGSKLGKAWGNKHRGKK